MLAIATLESCIDVCQMATTEVDLPHMAGWTFECVVNRSTKVPTRTRLTPQRCAGRRQLQWLECAPGTSDGARYQRKMTS